VNASGKAIDSVTGRPIPNLHLHMECPGGSHNASGDEQAAFTFAGVPESVCAISIDGHGLSEEYVWHFNGTEKEKPWIIRMIPRIVITGTVVDEKGSPLWLAPVYLETSVVVGGVRSQKFSGGPATDRQGRFRIESPPIIHGFTVN
jgi:hypothetical protein